jgi:type VI secretion system protein ImpF
MARKPANTPVTLSVLDRLIYQDPDVSADTPPAALIDQDPKVTAEAPLTRSKSMRILKAALRRDLEWLLNTRQPLEAPPEGAAELVHSLYTYGLPDITSMHLVSVEDRTKLARIMETALLNFEPRLANPKVRFVEREQKSFTLQFVIEGFLRIDPAPEYVTFDTVLETANGAYAVKGEAGAR